MTEQQSDNQQQSTETVVELECSHPGELLKKAREAKGLTQAEVAQKLNFLPIYIPALENEEFEPLHSVTFIKGYLRAYARFLEIDADEVLRCFAVHHPNLMKQEPHQPVEVMKPEKNTSSLAFKLFSIIIALALIAIIIVWWQSHTTEPLPSVSSQSVQVDTLDGNTIVAPVKVEKEKTDVTASTEEVEATNEAAITPVVTEENTEKNKPLIADPQAKPNAAAKPAASPAEQATSNQPVVAVKPITGDPAAATRGNDKLVALSFNNDCWVEVKDASGQILHASLMQTNDQILLEGQPPFQVVFGNGTFAKVFYAGKNFDFSSRIRPNGYASIQVK